MSQLARGFGRRTCAALVVVTVMSVAGCVQAGSSGSPSAPPSSASSASRTAIQTASPTASSAGTVDLNNVPAAPSGTWTGVQWVALPAGTPFKADPAAPDAMFQVFGWSRGYVGFAVSPNQTSADQGNGAPYVAPTVVPSYSADGVHWHAGQKLNVTAAGSSALQMIRAVLEGPAGLLAVGWSGACGSEYVDSLWTSSNGVAWQAVNARKAFGVDPSLITHISGGAAGYVAVSFKSRGAWTSKDGRTWHKVAFSADAFKEALVDDGTAFSGGFVLAGTTGAADCTAVVSDGSTPRPILRTAAAWWSADASSWTRIPLPGAVATPDAQFTWVSNLGDRAVLIVQDTPDGKRSAWGSHDGRTWTSVDFPSGPYQWEIVSGGQHNLIVEPAGSLDKAGPLTVRTLDDNFGLATVKQTGELPNILYSNPGGYSYGMVAIGPTGVVVKSSDGGQLWYGKPSAG
jgi:hypothetical protein